MSIYHPPVEDITFALSHVAQFGDVASLPGYEHVDDDLARAILDEAGRFAAKTLAPTNWPGDQHGAIMENGVVRTPPGFADAYRQFAEGGWMGLVFPEAFGGQDLPWTLNTAVAEMWNSANMTLQICPLLTQAAAEAVLHDGTGAQRETYLRPLVEGRWTGAMCLTEPHAGTDVGSLRTKAVPDGQRYRISGQKIFITYGDHDMAENMVHLVLARLPGAPEGTKGISLFLVPKYLPDENGRPGQRNDMRVLKIEEKLGVHGSPTCVMAYGEDEGAIGYLLGREQNGMAVMFTMMNNARLAVGLEGLGLAERAFQQAQAYARERQQFGRAIATIPDVRRMLVNMRARIAAMRSLCLVASAEVDRSYRLADDVARKAAANRVALLTPIVKAWCTDLAQVITYDAIQIHGGMGFVEETGVAQHYRDARILPIYEGTNGVQAMDLVGRKLSMEEGALPWQLIEGMRTELEQFPGRLQASLSPAVDAMAAATEQLQAVGSDERQAAGADYLELCGITLGGFYLARGASVPEAEQTAWPALAQSFAASQLPKTQSLLACIRQAGHIFDSSLVSD